MKEILDNVDEILEFDSPYLYMFALLGLEQVCAPIMLGHCSQLSLGLRLSSSIKEAGQPKSTYTSKR